MTTLRPILYILAGIVIGIFLPVSVCNKPGKGFVPQRLYDSVVVINNDIIKNNLLLRDTVFVMKIREAHSDSIIKHYEQQKEVSDQKFTKQIVALTFQRNKLRIALSVKDTSGVYDGCEEFMKLYDSIFVHEIAYRKIVDSMQVAYQQRKATDSTDKVQLLVFIAQKNSIIDRQQLVMKEMVNENIELRRQLARSKRGKRILAALGVIVGAAGTYMITK